MRVPSWLRFWSSSSWREWRASRRLWHEHKRSGGQFPRPVRPVSPVWVPAAIVVALVAFSGSGQASETEPLAVTQTVPGVETTPSSSLIATTTTTTAATTTTTTSAPQLTTTTATLPQLPQSELILAPPLAGPSGDPEAPAPADAESVTVASITDGDTLTVGFDNGSSAVIRLIGINSPESNECFSDEATLALAALTSAGARIGMTVDVSATDQFGRLLRYLWVGEMSVNEELVRRGAAIARRYPPDTAMAERFAAAQVAARESGVGLWAAEACGPRSDAILSIVAVEFDAPGDDSQNLNEEWAQIRNDSDAPVDLTGWGVKDESASNRYRFPDGFTLAAGESVTIHSGCGTDFDTALFWCSVGAAVWNNDGDTVFLLDPNGNTHVFREYVGEATTTTAAPVTTSPPINSFVGSTDCDPSYPDVCIPPRPPDLDCGEISHRRFRVLPPDPHGFDGDDDGVGCES